MEKENVSDHPIDYEKYLSCPDCHEIEFYCPKHKAEVESLLGFGDEESIL